LEHKNPVKYKRRQTAFIKNDIMAVSGFIFFELVSCLKNKLSYRPKGDILHIFKIIKISRYARNDTY